MESVLFSDISKLPAQRETGARSNVGLSLSLSPHSPTGGEQRSGGLLTYRGQCRNHSRWSVAKESLHFLGTQVVASKANDVFPPWTPSATLGQSDEAK